MYPDTAFLFVGARGKMEMEKVPEAGYKIEGLWISGLQRKLTLENLAFPFKVISSTLKARRILDRFKPNVVVGVGGYASGPMLRVAASKGIPTLIQEQNSYAGLTNKLLGKRVKKICVAYENMDRYFPADKIVITGNPVRSDIMDIEKKRKEALTFFRLNPDKKTVFAVGGSLGARTINNSMLQAISAFAAAGIQVIWQIGRIYFKEFTETLKDHDKTSLRVYEFLKEMDLAYAAADVVISRAGALAISELCIAGKPTIFVPSPNVSEDHQTKNAMALVNRKAAKMVPDQEAVVRLARETLDLLNNEPLQKELRQNILKLAKPKAAEEIANEVIKLAS